MRQCLPHGAWSGGVRCFPPDRLSQAAQSPPESQVQRQPCSTAKQSRSCTATPSDEQLLAELEDFDQQCLQAYITSSRSTDQAPHFEDEAEFNLFQQEAAARCKLDAARREAEALLEADAEQDSVLQAAAQSALAEREACCQQLHFAAELMSKPHKFSEMAMEDLSNLQAAAQHFLSVCNDVRDLLHEEELIKVQREKQKIAEALHAAEALAENHTGQFV